MSYVFVYGTLKHGYGNHRLLEDAKFIGAAMSATPSYDLYNLGYFPGLKYNGTRHVIGEIYEVNEKEMQQLDWLEGHPNHYRRFERSFDLLNDEQIVAWVYIYQYETTNKQLLTSGCWPETKQETETNNSSLHL